MESIFNLIDTNLNQESSGNDPTGCIKATDDAVGEVIDHHLEIPVGTVVNRCNGGPSSDPHHWLEITLPDGRKCIWDRSEVKIGHNHWLPLNEAVAKWPGFAEPEGTLQAFPLVEE